MSTPILAISDIHGRSEGVELVKRAIEKYRPSMILSLGDQCPYEGETLFNKLRAVRGNCDRLYEYTGIEFPPLFLELDIFSKRAHLTHGHMYSPEDFDLKRGDLFIQGHTHIPALEKRDGYYFINPGSVSYPRSSSGPTFALLEEEKASILSLLDFKKLKALRYSD